ncbi:hypothetical protein QE392_003330 [Microbacterium proteolyticum]|nr:hypothetical protein [Microbacterium sp. SORGH_AS_0344]MDQ1171526.1 hypothetical protein [Microbacterium proteolyticum]
MVPRPTDIAVGTCAGQGEGRVRRTGMPVAPVRDARNRSPQAPPGVVGFRLGFAPRLSCPPGMPGNDDERRTRRARRAVPGNDDSRGIRS